MSILELAGELSLDPKRCASTNGGEYHSSCPKCGGIDRFIIWESKGRYWCRQCDSKGDAIQFCRDFLGLDYRSACLKAGQLPKESFSNRKKLEFSPEKSTKPSEAWQKRAETFVASASIHALNHLVAIDQLKDRGLSIETIKSFNLGWNGGSDFQSFDLWGLLSPDSSRRVWLPRGIVIPSFFEGSIAKLKIRRADWYPDDKFPKYVEVCGSQKTPSFFGATNDLPIVILEAELDAILVQQFAGDLCCCMAIGGAGKKPDNFAHQILLNAPLVIFALDFDEAGKKAYRFWKSTYPNLKPWPVPEGKSPGDAFKLGVNLRDWVASAIN